MMQLSSCFLLSYSWWMIECLPLFAWRRVVLRIFDPIQLLRVSCILWCHSSKWIYNHQSTFKGVQTKGVTLNEQFNFIIHFDSSGAVSFCIRKIPMLIILCVSNLVTFIWGNIVWLSCKHFQFNYNHPVFLC